MALQKTRTTGKELIIFKYSFLFHKIKVQLNNLIILCQVFQLLK